MPITLVATPGADNANSLGTLEEADAYFATQLYATAWTGVADDEKRKQALITATMRFEALPWDGYRASSTQRLSHPRCGLTMLDGDSVTSTDIAPDIKIACFEEALDLLSKGSDPDAISALANFASLKVGPIALSLRESAPRTNSQRRDIIWDRLAPYLQSSTSFDRG